MLKRNSFFLLLLSLAIQTRLQAAQMNVEVKEQEEKQLSAQEVLPALTTAIVPSDIEAIIQMIIDTRAHPNLRDDAGDTALMTPILWNNMNKLRLIISAGANLDLQDNDGDTALIRATRHGRQNVVQSLIAAGADKNIRNKKNQTALDTASPFFRDDYIAAVKAGEKMRQRYEYAQEVAKKELEQYMIPDLAKITAEYAYNPQNLEDLPQSPEPKKLSWWDKVKKLASKLSRGNK